ncbi:MAG: hypothetical protein P1V35_02650 [Planctomycetota bacterium]|nr:hypothetical protein [Planctomycetota bacterium]
MTQFDHNPHLSIETPCPKTWAELDGDNLKRFCGKCQKHVHNGESMTRSEAAALVRQGEGDVCMRLVTDDEGSILYKDSPRTSKPSSIVRRAGLAIAAGGLVAACTSQPEKQDDPIHPPVLGTEKPVQTGAPTSEIMLETLGEICVEPEPSAAALPERPIDYNMIGQVKVTTVPVQPQLLGRVRLADTPEPPVKDSEICEKEKPGTAISPEMIGTPAPPPREILGTPGPPAPQ